MKKIEYENGAFEVAEMSDVQPGDEGVYLYWARLYADDHPTGSTIKTEDKLFNSGVIYQKISDIPKRPQRLRTFEPGLYRVRGGDGLGYINDKWSYRIRKENGDSVDLSGEYQGKNFDTRYDEYEQAEFKPVGEG
jgi:hypothetical protein